MATPSMRYPQNQPGAYYVDRRCIDCDRCRQIAPAHFERHADGHSYVQAQPTDEAGERACSEALAHCPVNAIGSDGLAEGPPPMRRLLPDLWACGHPSPLTDGAEAYLLVRPSGNVLVDIPAFVPALLREIESLGDLRTIFVTHRDHVGDLDAFQLHFGAEVVMHAAEAEAAFLGVDQVIDGPTALAPDLFVYPTPGHSPGSCCLLWRRHGGCLFTGDHLLPNGEAGLAPQRFEHTDDWTAQIESAHALLDAPWHHAFVGRGVEALPRGFVSRGREALASALARGA